jgi:hypothetical protein
LEDTVPSLNGTAWQKPAQYPIAFPPGLLLSGLLVLFFDGFFALLDVAQM